MNTLIIVVSLIFISIPLYILLTNKELGSLSKRILLLFVVFLGEPFDFWHGMFFVGLLGLAYGIFS